jgi:S-disulfanyl-L-cysteine oxidoreductase SoxD
MENDKWKMENRLQRVGMNKTKIVAAAILFLSVAAVFHPTLRAQQADKAPRSVWDGAFTKEQAKRGEGLYAQNCSSCHGPDLSGNDEAAPLTGSAFLSNWDGLTVGDLTERVRVSMPPNKLGTVSRQQIVDILSYVLSFNNFPAGKTELDPRAELLKQVRIEATKPKASSVSKPGS